MSTQRTLLCAAVALLMQWSVSGGMFLHASGLQAALVVGLTAGMVGSAWQASGCAAAATLVGGLTGPFSVWTPADARFSAAVVLWAVVAGVVAGAVALLVSRRFVDPRWLLALVVCVMVVNVWWTAIEIDATPVFDVRTSTNVPPVYQAIGGNPGGALRASDGYLFSWVLGKMRSGTNYYVAFAEARPSIEPGSAGATSVLNFREPLLYSLFAAAPSPWVIICGMLLLGTIAALSVFVLVGDVVRLPVALPGVAAVLTYTLPLATTTTVLFAEAWAGMLCLIALALHALSQRSARWRTLTVAAASVAVVALLVREFALAVILAGLVSSWFAEPARKRFRAIAWGAALAAGLIGYGLHVAAALPHVTHPAAGGTAEGFALFKGGMAFAAEAFTYDTHMFAFPFLLQQTIPVVLALLGIVGVWWLRTTQTKVMALMSIAVLILVDFVAGNSAFGVGTGESVNYWGMMMLFMVYACVPAALAVLPIARTRALAPGEES